jgi:flagellar motor switch protein FliN/FliY
MPDTHPKFIEDISVEVSIELGRTRMTIRELANLNVDDVLELAQPADRPLEVVAGGKILARGELVPVGDRLALRIIELAGDSASDTSD